MSKGANSGGGSACGVCGSVIPPRSPGGLCPQCLLKQGLSEITARNESLSFDFMPPSIEEMKPRFPELEVIELIGRGGMGAVYKARQTRLNRLVAIKIIPIADNAPERSERFMREAQTLARLNHPNIVTVFDVGEKDDYYYFVMEFVEGGDLKRLLSSRSISPYDALNISVALCDALQYAHDQGVIHRDIKPGNVLVDSTGRVKIADFGLAKILNPDSRDFSLTMSNDSMGTPYYMAPEQRSLSHSADHRADIYSLGVLMYEMLTGELPVGSFEPPSRKAKCDSGIDNIVIKALKANPALRYQSAGDIRADIEKLVAAGISRTTQNIRRSAISPVLFTLAVSAVILVGLVVGARWLSRKHIPPPPQDVVEFGGNYYKVYFENVDWHEAKNRCENMGGYLAVVKNKAEDDFLAALSRSHVWLGATDEGRRGAWTWPDGTPMAYSNWDIGEPNNAIDPKTDQGEHYLMISKYGKWNDLSLNSAIIKGFICEWDGSINPKPTQIRTRDDLHAALRSRNPEYNGKGVFELRNGVITGVTLSHTGVTNLSPLRGLHLTYINLGWSDATDLSVLENMPIARIELTHSKAEDISSLAGLPLVELRLEGTKVKDLSPLIGMALTYLDISHSKVTDLSPLIGMPLEELHMNCVKVTDLSPLAGMPLRKIGLLDVPAKDISPLEKCTALESVVVSASARNIECLRKLPSLKLLNNKIPDEFWKEFYGSTTNAAESAR